MKRQKKIVSESMRFCLKEKKPMLELALRFGICFFVLILRFLFCGWVVFRLVREWKGRWDFDCGRFWSVV